MEALQEFEVAQVAGGDDTVDVPPVVLPRFYWED
jgi:hypothetical protein